jgi:hypothetical protein
MVQARRPFSHKLGLVPADVIQIEDMTAELRARLLNVFLSQGPRWGPAGKELLGFAQWVIDSFFAKPFSAVGGSAARKMVADHFASAPWNEVYDLLQVTFKYPAPRWMNSSPERYAARLNAVLEEENAAYRVIDGAIVQMTNRIEVDAIQHAIDGPEEIARRHMQNALELFAARENPNYAKVIQEAVSGVEALLRAKSGEKGFSDGVKQLLRDTGDLHPTLLAAIDKIHGWSSDAQGIRHASKPGHTEPDLALARFMLVWCSAFMGYMQEPRT